MKLVQVLLLVSLLVSCATAPGSKLTYTPAVSRQFSTAPQRALLGYRDAVPPQDAIIRTAQWLAAHPEFLASEGEAGNPYAYEVEDKLIASFTAWQKGVDLQVPRAGTE